MSQIKSLCATESLVEDVPQINFVVCPAKIEDCDHIYELVQEYYSEYGIPSNRHIDKETFRRDGFESQKPSFQCFIAKTREQEDDVIFGFVIWLRQFENITTGHRLFLEALKQNIEVYDCKLDRQTFLNMYRTRDFQSDMVDVKRSTITMKYEPNFSFAN